MNALKVYCNMSNNIHVFYNQCSNIFITNLYISYIIYNCELLSTDHTIIYMSTRYVYNLKGRTQRKSSGHRS